MRHFALALLACLALMGCKDAQAPAVGQEPPHSEQAAQPWEGWMPPEVTMPDPNAFDTYRQAFERLAALHAPASVDRAPTIEESRAYVEGHRETVMLLRQALAGECRVPAPQDFYDIGLPLGAQFRSAARLLAIHKARVDRADGQYLKAARDAIDTLRLGHDMATQRMIIAALVGVACEAIGLSSLEQTIPHLTAAECRSAIEWLQQAEAERIPFREVVEGEAIFARRTFIDGIVEAEVDLAEIERESELPAGSMDDLATSWRAMDELIEGALAYADQPYWAADLEVEVDDPLAELFFGGDTLAFCRMPIARAQALSRIALAHLASQAYWRDNGQPPDSLTTLAPEYLAEVPTDTFSGKPLQAKRDGERFVIYSVGPDGTDDGGKEVEGPIGEENKGDIVVTVQQPVPR
jgi:hypothetical protein